jgi:hypothetical protein
MTTQQSFKNNNLSRTIISQEQFGCEKLDSKESFYITYSKNTFSFSMNPANSNVLRDFHSLIGTFTSLGIKFSLCYTCRGVCVWKDNFASSLKNSVRSCLSELMSAYRKVWRGTSITLTALGLCLDPSGPDKVSNYVLKVYMSKDVTALGSDLGFSNWDGPHCEVKVINGWETRIDRLCLVNYVSCCEGTGKELIA